MKKDGLFIVTLISVAALLASAMPFNVVAYEAPLQAVKPSIPKEIGGLSQQDQDRYRLIFAMQSKGRMDDANVQIAQLDDKRLLGHILFQRYMHPTAYTSSYGELKTWLKFYHDHPGADRVYALALRKASSEKQKAALRGPAKRTKILTRMEPTMVAHKPYHKQKSRHISGAKLEKRINSYLRKGQSSKATDLLFKQAKDNKLSAEEIDYLKAEIAASYMYSGNMRMAYELAHQAFERSGKLVPKAGWVCGLVSWYNGYYDFSARFFESAAISPYASGWMQSAAGYWAARANTRLGKKFKVDAFLSKARAHPRTFYGLMATQAARGHFDFDWSLPKLTKSLRQTLTQSPAANRALALLDIGQRDLAEQELIYVEAGGKDMRKALIALGAAYDLPALSIRVGSLLYKGDNHFYDAALYPDLSLVGRKTDFRIDPALVHAIVRQESRFDTFAQSHSGAKGLMQIMPRTAEYIADKKDAPLKSIRHLVQPSVNINLGQHYVADLLKHPAVDGDLISALIAYNAGPGNLSKWRKRWSDVDDPLLFIELLPASQTRDYVERVLANYWIYKIKSGRKLDTLEAMARAKPVSYELASKGLPFKIAQTR